MPLLFPVPLLLRDHGNRTFAQVLAKAAVVRMADIGTLATIGGHARA